MSRLVTPLTELVGVDHPIVQTGMGWVAGSRLVAASAEAGALGILASATMTLPQLVAAVAEVKSRTTASFGVNLRTDQADIKERVHRALELLLGEDLTRIERLPASVSVQSAGNQDVRVSVLLDDIALEHAANRIAQAVAQAFGTPVTQDLAK